MIQIKQVKQEWLNPQDRTFIENVCGDYAQDIIDLINEYRFTPKLLNKELVSRLSDSHYSSFFYFCANNSKDMDLDSLNEWNPRIYDLLYEGIYKK